MIPWPKGGINIAFYSMTSIIDFKLIPPSSRFSRQFRNSCDSKFCEKISKFFELFSVTRAIRKFE
jgi:hypothetical protein